MTSQSCPKAGTRQAGGSCDVGVPPASSSDWPCRLLAGALLTQKPEEAEIFAGEGRITEKLSTLTLNPDHTQVQTGVAE